MQHNRCPVPFLLLGLVSSLSWAMNHAVNRLGSSTIVYWRPPSGIGGLGAGNPSETCVYPRRMVQSTPRVRISSNTTEITPAMVSPRRGVDGSFPQHPQCERGGRI